MKKALFFNTFYKYFVFTAIASLLLSCASKNKSYDILSPDGKIRVQVNLDQGGLNYSVFRGNEPVLLSSALGLKLKEAESLEHNFELLSAERNSFHETWEQVWGESRLVDNKYDELTLYLQERNGNHRKLNLIFRVFNDGIGFRYQIPEQEGITDFTIMDELTEFRLPGVLKAWWIPAYKEKFYESLYRHTPVNEMDTVCTPLTLENSNGSYIAIHEANLTNYAAMNLFCRDSTTLSCDLTPWSNGDKVRTTTPFVSPWRIVIIADTAGDLITSRLMLNLNEPCKIDDTSWIRPGKYIGIWWGMHQNKYTWSQGPKHGATTENVLRYIDFAAKNHFDGVLVEGWNYGWDEDWTVNGHLFSFTKPYPDFDMERIAAYAKKKGVQLIGHHETGGATINYEKQMEEAFSLYNKYGISIVKTGYVSAKLDGKEFHSSQYGVQHYRKVIESAARHKIMIDNHEPVMPTGLQRTYPNLMTQEGVRGQEWDAWSTDGGNPPEHTTIVPFTRGLAGPMDFTFGTFNFTNPVLPNTRVRTTLAKQVALYMVIYSPLQMASDLIENYVQNEAFDFIKTVPVNWEDTRVLDAAIGDFVVIARKDRQSEDWYCGAITDEAGRTLSISLDFLTPEFTYRATIIADASDSDWESNPTAFASREETVTYKDTMDLVLAPGGGQAIHFSPVE